MCVESSNSSINFLLLVMLWSSVLATAGDETEILLLLLRSPAAGWRERSRASVPCWPSGNRWPPQPSSPRSEDTRDKHLFTPGRVVDYLMQQINNKSAERTQELWAEINPQSNSCSVQWDVYECRTSPNSRRGQRCACKTRLEPVGGTVSPNK